MSRSRGKLHASAAKVFILWYCPCGEGSDTSALPLWVGCTSAGTVWNGLTVRQAGPSRLFLKSLAVVISRSQHIASVTEHKSRTPRAIELAKHSFRYAKRLVLAGPLSYRRTPYHIRICTTSNRGPSHVSERALLVTPQPVSTLRRFLRPHYPAASPDSPL